MLNVTRWTPWTEPAALHRDLDSIFGRVFGDTASRSSATAWAPAGGVRPEGAKSMLSVGLRCLHAALMVLLASTVVAAQPDAPLVTMNVTLPDGRMQQLTAPESGLAKLTLSDGTEYAFRPTIQDSAPWNRIVVTIFRTPTASAAAESLGELEMKRGGPAVESKTKPGFKVSVPAVSAATMGRSTGTRE